MAWSRTAEADEYDALGPTYIIAANKFDRVIGCARLAKVRPCSATPFQLFLMISRCRATCAAARTARSRIPLHFPPPRSDFRPDGSRNEGSCRAGKPRHRFCVESAAWRSGRPLGRLGQTATGA